MHKYIWHLSNERWQKAFDKVYDKSTSFMATHQRHMDKVKNKILEGIKNLKKRGKK